MDTVERIVRVRAAVAAAEGLLAGPVVSSVRPAVRGELRRRLAELWHLLAAFEEVDAPVAAGAPGHDTHDHRAG